MLFATKQQNKWDEKYAVFTLQNMPGWILWFVWSGSQQPGTKYLDPKFYGPLPKCSQMFWLKFSPLESEEMYPATLIFASHPVTVFVLK